MDTFVWDDEGYQAPRAARPVEDAYDRAVPPPAKAPPKVKAKPEHIEIARAMLSTHIERTSAQVFDLAHFAGYVIKLEEVASALAHLHRNGVVARTRPDVARPGGMRKRRPCHYRLKQLAGTKERPCPKT